MAGTFYVRVALLALTILVLAFGNMRHAPASLPVVPDAVAPAAAAAGADAGRFI